MGNQEPRQLIGRNCMFVVIRVIFYVVNAKSVVKWIKKRVQDISKGKISDTKY